MKNLKSVVRRLSSVVPFFTTFILMATTIPRIPLEVRWSDLDPNFHLRHTVYYDYGAFCRIAYFQDKGLTPDFMQQHAIGPVLFREECTFRKEIRFGDQITIDLQVVKLTQDFSRWSIRHQFWKNGDTPAAQLVVEGAWMDTVKRKLTTPVALAQSVFEQMPRAPEFEWIKR